MWWRYQDVTARGESRCQLLMFDREEDVSTVAIQAERGDGKDELD